MKPIQWLALFGVALALNGCDSRRSTSAPPPGTFQHEAYLWQRVHSPAVQRAITLHGTNFQRLVVLAAEVAWPGGRAGVTRAKLNYPVLASSGVPIGLALRIGPCPPRVLEDSASRVYLVNLSEQLLREAAAAGLRVTEFQLDFDCAESRLTHYRKWVEAIRARITPIQLTITALPAWLNRSAFVELARAADGLVLQVHSLERPKSFADPAPLCDPDNALKSVEQCARFGRPFRVALPTYSYLLAFSTNDTFIGLSAEGPAKNWPPSARVRELSSDPVAISGLLTRLRSNPPPWMSGVIWYRLPCDDDTLNWRWPTLRAMVESRLPRKSFRAELRRVEPQLRDVILVNDGELDISSRLVVKVSCGNGRFVAGDCLGGFELVERSAAGMVIHSRKTNVIRAGETRTIAWIRLDEDREVKIEFGEL